MSIYRQVFFFSLFLVGFCSQASAQGLAAGAWRYHGYYGRDSLLALSPTKVYASNGVALMTYDRTNGDLGNISKIEGLSDVTVTAIAHAYTQELLVVGYRSGGIDLVQGKKITTLDGLVRSGVSVSKSIYAIDIIDNLAFVSGEFGFLVVDLNRREIKSANTALDASGSNQNIAVRSVCRNRNALYLATSNGIYSIGADQNLQDSRLYSVERIGTNNLPQNGGKLLSVRASGGRVYALFQNAGLFVQINGVWQAVTKGLLASPFRSLSSLQGNLLLSVGSQIVQVSDTNYQLLADSTGPIGAGAPKIALSDTPGEIWVSDLGSGLLRLKGAEVEGFQTSSPGFANIFKLYGYQNKMIALPGGYTQTSMYQVGNKNGIGVYQNNFWTYWRPGKELPKGVEDICTATYSALSKSLILSSYGAGLIFVPDDTSRADTIVNDTTRTRDKNLFESALPTIPGEFVRVPFVTTDANGNIWATSFSDIALHLRDLDHKWYAYNGPQQFLNRSSGVQIEFDNAFNKYIRMEVGRGNQDNSIMVRSADNKTWGTINSKDGQGALPSPDVYDLAVDKDGALWIGTGQGLAVLYSPSVALESTVFSATLPIFEGRPLLENDACTAIALDGGGRKWVGTRNSGVWLFDKDVTKVLANFNTENSPLPSNNITDIALVPATGEVFMATADGLVSYNSVATDATLTESENSCVRIYPSPVRPGYTGNIAIDCLPENAVVKITDAAGRLVHEAVAAGGGIIWNGLDYTGRKPRPGVYLVYAYSETKAAGIVGRFAIVE